MLGAFLVLLTGRIVYWIVAGELTVPELKWLLIGERLDNGFIMYRDLYDYTGPLSSLTYKIIDLAFGRSIWPHRILGLFLVFYNAAILSIQLAKSKVFAENNYLPGFFYVLFALAIPEGGNLSPMLMSSTFIILGLSNVFRRVDNEASDELFLYAGLYLGIAVLFYLPSVTFFFILLLSLLIFSSAIPRRIFLYIYGLTVPLILAIANFYWYDAFDYFMGQFFLGGFILDRRFFLDWPSFWIVSGVFVFWTFYALIVIIRRGRYGNYETKVIQIMLLVAIAAAVSVLVDVSLQPAQLHLLIPALAFFLAHLALLLKKRFYKFLIPWIIFLSLVTNAYWAPAFADLTNYILDSQTIPGIVEAKAMVLSDQPETYYAKQQIAGPFFNKELSINQMNYLVYYETAYQIYDAIQKDLPQVIIDDWLLMPAVFERFPTLKEQYRAGSNNRYYLKDN